MKAAKDENNSLDLNGRTPTIRQDFAAIETSGSRAVPRRPSTGTTSQPPPGSDMNITETSLRKMRQSPSGNSVEMSQPELGNPRSTAARTISNQNNTANKEIHRRIDAEDEPSLIPPNRTHPLATQCIATSEEWRDEDRAETEIPSSSASTSSSFLEAAAAIPPRLTKQETTPGAVCVPGLGSSFDCYQHDNLLDMADENDEDNHISTNNHSFGTISRSPTTRRRSAASTVQSPQLTSYTFHSQSTSTSIPIVAELAPSYAYSEQDVEDRLAERLEAQMEAQITERLQQEVDRRFSQDQRQHAIAEVVGSSNDTRYIFNTKVKKEVDDENFKICGIRRTWWGMILCVVVLLAIAGVGGAYLWFSRARERATSATDDIPSPSIGATASPGTQPTARTISPMPSSSRNTSISTSSNTTDVPPIFVNLTAVPTPTPLDSNGPFTLSSMPSSTNRRREHLISSIAPYVVPDDFAELPATYFVNDAYIFQSAALDWMASIDLETDIFGMPVQLLVERYVLAVLYYSTGGARKWTESLSFLSSSNVCDWNNEHSIRNVIVSSGVTAQDISKVTEEPADYSLVKKGVFCRNGSLFVTNIQIPDNSLKGRIPWELSLLEQLTLIDFDTNKLYGSIPIELSRLSRLQGLWLMSNNLKGRLPSEFSNATELASIDLEDNSLTFQLPPEWGSLSNLFYVSLTLNNITGTLPSEWRTLSRLKTLDLEGNQLHGTLPEEYGEMTKLESLYVESNRFEGPLPPTFGNLTNLVHLFVDDNFFSGTVPTEYSALTNLEYFWFDHNLLTGSVDGTFCDSNPRLNGTNLKSNCLGNDLGGIQAQIECSCCTVCCDSNGTNCIDYSLQ